MKASHQRVLNLALGALMLLVVMSYSKTSHACRTNAEFKIEDVVLADSVFIGQLVKYEVLKPKAAFDLSAYAVLTFVVEEHIGGKVSKGRIDVYWHNSTFGMPASLNLNRYLVAVATDMQPPLRGPSAAIFPSQRPDLPSVLQAPCAAPFLLEPTTQNIEQVTNLLNVRHHVQEPK